MAAKLFDKDLDCQQAPPKTPDIRPVIAQEVVGYWLGKRFFRTRYGLFRQLAKWHLIAEVDEALYAWQDEQPQEPSHALIVRQRQIIYSGKFPWVDKEGGRSAFSEAVTKKAKELMIAHDALYGKDGKGVVNA